VASVSEATRPRQTGGFALAVRCFVGSLVLALGLGAGTESLARAFSDPRLYGRVPTDTEGGGGGRWFTGSPADGYGCSVCHTAPSTYSFPLVQTGLPKQGYVPGKRYSVHLTWPDAAMREAQAATLNLDPRTSLIAEFVAENGTGSGTIQLQPENDPDANDCRQTPTDATKTYATSVYFVGAAPGSLPIMTSNTCFSSKPGERCLVAMNPCGATQVTFAWTPADQWRGPIWFSAGFVTTTHATGIPNDDDYVTELNMPMNAASDGAAYEKDLSAGCSLTRPAAVRGKGWLVVVLGLGLLRLRSRRLRRGAR
jgi:hypothetical protein